MEILKSRTLLNIEHKVRNKSIHILIKILKDIVIIFLFLSVFYTLIELILLKNLPGLDRFISTLKYSIVFGIFINTIGKGMEK